jgi:hypothetical protein
MTTDSNALENPAFRHSCNGIIREFLSGMRSASSQIAPDDFATISEALFVSIAKISGKPLDERHRQIVLEELRAAIISRE